MAVAAGAWIAAGTAAGETPRPRLGLALSGGGARGLAHVGVLRYLEDHCIPVDAVAGTSMGGLLGGLYAMGYEAEELRGLVAGIDWDQLSRTGPPYRDQSYRRKEDARHLAGGVELGLRDGLTLPSGLSAGPEITFLLDRLALPYGGIGDFDRLPTPLRVTATDLLDAVPVTLGEGSLPEAMRATLSIPGVFTPVERDGRLLVDGGVLENLPVEVARWMGSDRVLAVDAGTPLLKREELGSVLSMLDQTFGVMMMESIRRNRAAADVLLVPDLGRYSNQSFRKLEALDALGYQAASLQADQLAPYAVDETAWQDWREARARRRLLATPLPERLRVVGVEGREAASLSGRLSGLTGAGFTVEGLEAELRRILGEGRYERLSYEVEAEAGGGTLVVRAERKRHGPPFLKLGLELSNARPDTLNATIGARLTVLDLGASGSEWRTDVALGARGELRSEIYRPLAGGRIFVSPRAYLEDRDQDLYGEDERQAIWATRRTGAGGDLGLALGHNAELRVGFDLRQLSSHLSAGPPGQATPEGAEAVVGARFGLDRSDAPVIPGRGLRAAAAAEWWIDSPGLAGDRLRLEGSLGPALKLGRRSSVLLHASGGAGVGGDLPLELDFTLGGPLRLSAYGLDQFRGDNYLLFNAGLLRQVATLPLLFNGRVYGLGLLEAGSAFDRSPAEAHYRTCLTAALLAETRLAMLTFGVSFAHDRSANWIFALGPRF